MCVSFCEPGGNLYGSQSWPDPSHVATGDGSSESISATITKPKSAPTKSVCSTASPDIWDVCNSLCERRLCSLAAERRSGFSEIFRPNSVSQDSSRDCTGDEVLLRFRPAQRSACPYLSPRACGLRSPPPASSALVLRAHLFRRYESRHSGRSESYREEDRRSVGRKRSRHSVARLLKRPPGWIRSWNLQTWQPLPLPFVLPRAEGSGVWKRAWRRTGEPRGADCRAVRSDQWEESDPEKCAVAVPDQEYRTSLPNGESHRPFRATGQ